MSDYKITEKEEKELKAIDKAFGELDLPPVNPPHNDAISFEEEKHKERSDYSLSLSGNMWENMKDIGKK